MGTVDNVHCIRRIIVALVLLFVKINTTQTSSITVCKEKRQFVNQLDPFTSRSMLCG